MIFICNKPLISIFKWAGLPRFDTVKIMGVFCRFAPGSTATSTASTTSNPIVLSSPGLHRLGKH